MSALAVLTGRVAAMDIDVSAYLDVRIVVPASERGWIDGGLGKFRFGAGQPSPNLRVVEGVAQIAAALDDDLHAVTVLRAEAEQRTGVDVLETYIAWRPQADGNWRWSVKAGAFFPSIGLENTDLGWTSPYTLTPSAIDSWIGDELRTVGGEGTLERGAFGGTLSLIGAVYCCNEPAGILIAERGWTLDDRPTGLIERVRIPDATAALFGMAVPSRAGLFQEIDGDLGWYAGLGWRAPEWGSVSALYYDNDADPAASTARDTAWRTRFWSVSARTSLAGVTLLAQGLSGSTMVGAGPPSTTRFSSAYILASYDIGDWRASARAEAFQTRANTGTLLNEDGHAFTGALSWSARDWLRLTAEAILLDSRKRERALEGEAPARTDTQLQLGARFYL